MMLVAVEFSLSQSSGNSTRQHLLSLSTSLKYPRSKPYLQSMKLSSAELACCASLWRKKIDKMKVSAPLVGLRIKIMRGVFTPLFPVGTGRRGS